MRERQRCAFAYYIFYSACDLLGKFFGGLLFDANLYKLLPDTCLSFRP